MPIDESNSETIREIRSLDAQISTANDAKVLRRAYYDRGYCYGLLGDAAKSRDDYFQALTFSETAEDKSSAKAMIALSYAQDNEPIGGLFWALGAVDADSTNPANLYALGLICSYNCLFNLAIDFLNRCIELRKNDWDAMLKLGECLREAGRIQESVSALSQFVEVNPRNPIGLYELGLSINLCSTVEKNTGKALELYRKAWDANPTPELRSAIESRIRNAEEELKSGAR